MPGLCRSTFETPLRWSSVLTLKPSVAGRLWLVESTDVGLGWQVALIKAAFEEPPFFLGGGTSNLMLKCVVYSELFEGFP